MMMYKISVYQGVCIETAALVWSQINTDPLRVYYMYDGFPSSLDEFMEDSPDWLVAHIDDEPAAIVTIRDRRYHAKTNKPAYINVGLLYVIPEYRGLIATLLCRAMIDCVIDTLGFKNIFLYTRYDHYACMGLIDRLGFYRIGIRPGFEYFNGQPTDVIEYSWLPPMNVKDSNHV